MVSVYVCVCVCVLEGEPQTAPDIVEVLSYVYFI